MAAATVKSMVNLEEFAEIVKTRWDDATPSAVADRLAGGEFENEDFCGAGSDRPMVLQAGPNGETMCFQVEGPMPFYESYDKPSARYGPEFGKVPIPSNSATSGRNDNDSGFPQSQDVVDDAAGGGVGSGGSLAFSENSKLPKNEGALKLKELHDWEVLRKQMKATRELFLERFEKKKANIPLVELPVPKSKPQVKKSHDVEAVREEMRATRQFFLERVQKKKDVIVGRAARAKETIDGTGFGFLKRY